jgi:S-DNA-T family DNA segregation ATPase FtsK/SpoIIIE
MVIEQGRSLSSSPKRKVLREQEQPLLLGVESTDSAAISSSVAVVPPEAPKRVPLKDRVLDNYIFPPVKLLSEADRKHDGEDGQELLLRAQRIEQKLADFNIKGRIVQYQRGPVVSLFEFEPAPGVKLGRIVSLQDDLAMSLRASVVRIVAPIPGRGTVGIEVPNPRRDVVRLREVLESEEFHTHSSNLAVPLGKDISGLPVVVHIASMPHLLIAGATGTGKSVCLNTLLVSLLYRATPQELGLIMIDPKVLELSVYDGIPHLRVPVVTVPKQAKAVLEWAVKEMDTRYRLMQRFGVRNIDSFNRLARGEADPDAIIEEEPPVAVDEASEGEDTSLDDAPVISGEVVNPLPKIVIVVDELADLMLQVGRDIEELITRLAQKARAAGIHLILATQRPSVDVITGLIKANFPARLSFRVTSRIDSRTILDSMGAERLLGKGDMLFMSPGANPLRRVHGAFVTDAEVTRVVNAIKLKDGPRYDDKIVEFCEAAMRSDAGEGEDGNEGESEYDPFYDKAVELVVEKQHASTSLVQRVFRIGYNRAARIIERMEKEGIVTAMDGARPREVLIHQRPGDEPN